MEPQGSGLLNAAYYDSLTKELNGIQSCFGLQTAINEAMADMQAEITSIENQITALLPIITLPHDLPSLISWAAKIAAPYIKPYTDSTSQLTQTLEAIGKLTAAMAAAAARIGSCQVTIPTITQTPPLP